VRGTSSWSVSTFLSSAVTERLCDASCLSVLASDLPMRKSIKFCYDVFGVVVVKGLTKISKIFAFYAPFGKFSSILRRTPNSVQNY